MADVATRTIEQLPIDQVHPAPDNPRGDDLGDLTELAASMHPHGILQPLLVCPRPDGYLVVYGHRRRAAALKAGLTEIPAEVRDLDDTTRRELMLIENLHRDDLTPLQEARGYRDALDNNPELTQRQLAERVGKSQGHISKRLALLELTPKAQTLLEAGEITVNDAQKLHELKDMPKRMDAALQRPHNVQWAVEDQLRDHENKRKRGEAERRLKKAKVTIIKGPDHGSWYSFHAKPLAGQTHYSSEEVKVDAEAHAAEKCHAAVIGDRGEVTLVCTNPKRHRKGGDSAVKTGMTEEEKVERRATIARNKAVRAARDTRNEFMPKLLKRRIPLGELLPHIALQWIRHADGRTLEIACDMLNVKAEERHPYWTDYRTPLLTYAATSPDATARAGLALAFAASEQQQRIDHPQWDGEHLQAHFAFLEAHGYEVSDTERKELDQHRPRAERSTTNSGTAEGGDTAAEAPAAPAAE